MAPIWYDNILLHALGASVFLDYTMAETTGASTKLISVGTGELPGEQYRRVRVCGWRWAWVRGIRELVFTLDADAAGQQRWRELVRQIVRGFDVVTNNFRASIAERIGIDDVTLPCRAAER